MGKGIKRRFQVFISSTYNDLQAERQAAVSAVLKAGHIPAGMELFTAGDKSQMETIQQWIDDSDVYMLILGGRYGSIEPLSGMSYTELEYDYALLQKKPVFAVVIAEDALEVKVKENGTRFLERDNPKELARFRQKVLSNISSFFEDDKDIKLCVHESLAEFASSRELRGWVPADEVQDTKPLFDEISKLADENKRQRETIATLEQQATIAASQRPSQKKNEEFAELRKVLAAIEIKIPAELAGGTESAIDLLELFYGNKETLVNGVTNAAGASPGEIFFYNNVCPKLQVHGLVVSEKVAGARYRRCAVSARGREFLAEIERTIILPKIAAKSGSANAASDKKRTEAEAVKSESKSKSTSEVGKPSAK